MKVFSKEKYLKWHLKMWGDMNCPRWADKCDGKPVYDGFCTPGDGGKYATPDSWCIDVPDPKVSDILDIVKEENTMYTMKDFIEKPIAVRVGQTHKEEFLKMCEAEGLKWMSGKNATEFTPKVFAEDLCIAYSIPHFPSGLGWESAYQYKAHGIDVVDFKDIKPTAPRYQITIDCDGKTTTARMLVDGKEVKTGVAKYNPADKFDFSVGAKVAFDRLWAKSEPTKPEPVKSFKVGDRVKCTMSVDGRDNIVGKYGTVIHVMPNSAFPITVEFDDNIGAHDGLGRVSGKRKHCWWCPVDALELVTVSEVKRFANVGEYIKIVDSTDCSLDEYKNGDILKVVKVNKQGWAYYKDDIDKYAYPKEYVVLEGYVPPVKPAEFKVGDRVVCIKGVSGRDTNGQHGVIRTVSATGLFGVEFDNDVRGHELHGEAECKKGHGLWVADVHLQREYREVKRHAKAGEWVKIVDAKGHSAERYHNGDILKVTDEWVEGSGMVHLTCGGVHVCPNEYVVLEGYKG